MRVHYLEGGALFQHAVLVYAGCVAEGVRAHDRLVRLHGEAGDVADETAGAVNLARVDVGVHAVHVLARLQRHDDLFESGVAGALAEAVDAALDLPRALGYGGEAVADGLSEVVVAVNAQRCLVDVRHILFDEADALAELPGHYIAHRVGDVDGVRARRNRAFQHLV